MDPFERLRKAISEADRAAVEQILQETPDLIGKTDQHGASGLHYATLYGQREIAELLIGRGAEVNCLDGRFGATPMGWAVEYLREKGGYLATELEDLEFAMDTGDIRWIGRFLHRFPALRDAVDRRGQPFRDRAAQSGNQEVVRLFGDDATRM